MKIKSLIALIICIILLAYTVAYFHPDLTNNIGKVAVYSHLIISKDQAIAITEKQWTWMNQSKVENEDATLTYGYCLITIPIPIFEWIVHVDANTNGIIEGGDMYIEPFTGTILWTNPYV